MMLLGTLILGRPPFVFVDGLAKSTPAEASLFGSGYAGLGSPVDYFRPPTLSHPVATVLRTEPSENGSARTEGLTPKE